MAVARRAETYIRWESAPLVSSISRRGALTPQAGGGRSVAGSGTSRRSRWRRAGQRTRIYETVIFRKLRAGNSWPCRRFMAAVCPACAINPSLSPRIELPPILRQPSLPPSSPPPRDGPPSLLRYLKPPSSYTLFRVRMSERQRELISSFRRLIRTRPISPPSLFSISSFLSFLLLFFPSTSSAGGELTALIE